MFFSRKFQKLFSLLALLLWVHLDACMVYAATSQSANYLAALKLTPISSSENREVDKLFDRNTETAYAPAVPAYVDISFDSSQPLDEIRVYGAASYTLTAQGRINGQWMTIEPLEDIDLSDAEQQWHSYPFTESLTVDAVRLQFIPSSETGYGQGIREIEFWAPGEHEPVRSGKELLTLLDQGIAGEQGRMYSATPATGVMSCPGWPTGPVPSAPLMSRPQWAAM